jgi:hypothetical protein
MGHYRSEMGYEKEDEERAKREEAQRQELIKKIGRDIKKRGVAAALADVVLGNGQYRVKSH